jgi:hypothetical protein
MIDPGSSSEYAVLALFGFLLIFNALICGGIGALLGRLRSRITAGFWLGFLLGPVGWLLVGFLEDKTLRCPECFGTVLSGSTRCRHCAQTFISAPATIKSLSRRGINPPRKAERPQSTLGDSDERAPATGPRRERQVAARSSKTTAGHAKSSTPART